MDSYGPSVSRIHGSSADEVINIVISIFRTFLGTRLWRHPNRSSNSVHKILHIYKHRWVNRPITSQLPRLFSRPISTQSNNRTSITHNTMSLPTRQIGGHKVRDAFAPRISIPQRRLTCMGDRSGRAQEPERFRRGQGALARGDRRARAPARDSRDAREL